MDYITKKGNVYVIDTEMFGFEYYMSAFLVKGNELALIDTGVPTSFEVVRKSINQHGFSIEDIKYIFVTHEHPDHIGNVSNLLKEASQASVYMNPVGEKTFHEWSNPEKKAHDRFAERAGVIYPTPRSRIRHLHDGQVFDLGDGEILEIIFTPGHVPGGVTLLDIKNKGLYINDLIGNYFVDANAHLILLPMGSDIKQQIISMQKLIQLPVHNLYLGHYGIITENARDIMQQALDKMHEVLQIGISCIRQNKPELIGEKLLQYTKPYLENMRQARGEEMYQYITQLHLPFLIDSFTQYCKSILAN